MESPIRVLFVEDNPLDAELELIELERHGLKVEPLRVETRDDFIRGLEAFQPHLVISDFSMPHFDGMSALGLASVGLPDVPFIFVSGTIGEENAIESLRRGATDYVLKTNLARLGPAVERAIEESRVRLERRRYQSDLKETRDRLDSILGSLRDAVWSISASTQRVLFMNPASEDIYRRSLSEFFENPRLLMEIIHPEDRPGVMAHWDAFMLRDEPFDLEYRILRGDGEIRWIHDRARLVQDEQGMPLRVDGIARDITERKHQDEKIARLSRIHAVLGGVNSMIMRTRQGEDLYHEACRILVEAGGFRTAWIGLLQPDSEFLKWVGSAGKDVDNFVKQRTPVRGDGALDQSLSARVVHTGREAVCNDLLYETGPVFAREALTERGYRSSIILPLSMGGTVVGVLGLLSSQPDIFDAEEVALLKELASDISFAMEYLEKEERLHYLAYFDVLTGLPNGDLFRDRVGQLLRAAEANHGRVGVVMLDLERFSRVNETLGRGAGDKLIKEVAERLRQNLDGAHILARMGGDHFAVALDGVRDETEAAHLAESRIFGALSQPFQVEGHELRVSAKAGIAVFPADGGEAETLLRNTEAALKNAKGGGERYLFYAPRMNERVAEKLTIENRLRKAVEARHFVLHYQPKVSMEDRRITGVEALVRWMDPVEGLIPPLKFIPVLEETGLILELGNWILEQAYADHRAWVDAGLDAPRIAVNVSPLQLGRKDFVQTVHRAIKPGADSGVDLEITESMLMEDVEGSIEKLQQLREVGVEIFIDDFGTGYSSLNYLARLPVHCLKIDRAFVIRMGDRRDDHAIVASVISLAHTLGLKVVAEGVETEAQAQLLRLLGCDQIQGYLISKPVPREALEQMLKPRA